MADRFETDAVRWLMGASASIRHGDIPFATDLLTALLEPGTRSGRLLASFLPSVDSRHAIVRSLAAADVALGVSVEPLVMRAAAAEATRMDLSAPGADHMVLAVLAIPVPGIAAVLMECGIDLTTGRARVAELRATEDAGQQPSLRGMFGIFGAEARTRTWVRSVDGEPFVMEVPAFAEDGEIG